MYQALILRTPRLYLTYVERHAFGADEYYPVSQSSGNLTHAQSSASSTSIGYTIIDTLDMFLLLSLNQDGASLGQSYRRLRKWLKEEHTFDVEGNFNTFELTIRLLGGLLSAHWAEYEVGITPGLGSYEQEEDERFRASPTRSTDGDSPIKEASSQKAYKSSSRSGGDDDRYDPSDMLYLHKAVDLADRLMGAFSTRSGLPWSNINLRTRVGSSSDQEHGLVATAEIGTLQLEFRYLSYVLIQQLQQIPPAQLTSIDLPTFLKDGDGNPKTMEELRSYWNVVEHAMKVAREGTRGRLPSVFMNPEDGEFIISPVRLGSRGDSYFEYLLKQYLQTSRNELDLLRMWDDAIDQIHENLLLRTPKRDLLFIAELNPEQDEQGQMYVSFSSNG
ncbi:mannosyl-oligosaccharide alpha-1,2-mannosidase [Serendipita sp. 399]|nr:mannosyl-oligosaccharide alpha-1,2-mannosidase [Serendipita sp. 399]